MFKMPNAVSIMARSSSVTNSFANSIIPEFRPSQEEIAEALEFFDTVEGEETCVYCGGQVTEWDHLRPLVRDKRPTGYVSEIANLVPACGKCNQSKGGSYWRDWMLGPARLSPATRGVPDIDERIARLEAFEKWRVPRRVDFEAVAGAALWAQHWDNHDRLLQLMAECQSTARQIQAAVRTAAGPPQQRSKSASNVASSSHSQSLPIFLTPSDPGEFKAHLLARGAAVVAIHYSSGRVEEKPWIVSALSESSNVLTNLRSRPEFRRGEWRARGIASVHVRVAGEVTA